MSTNPAISKLFRVYKEAPWVGYLKEDQATTLEDWYAYSGTVRTVGMNQMEVIKYATADGTDPIAGFPRVEKMAVQDVNDTLYNMTFTDRNRDVSVCLEGILFKRNIGSAITTAYTKIAPGISGTASGVQEATSGKWCIGKNLFPIPAGLYGFCYVDALSQYEVA